MFKKMNMLYSNKVTLFLLNNNDLFLPRTFSQSIENSWSSTIASSLELGNIAYSTDITAYNLELYHTTQKIIVSSVVFLTIYWCWKKSGFVPYVDCFCCESTKLCITYRDF